MSSGRPNRGAPPASPAVTAREAEVLQARAKGASVHEIARRLFISDSTVRTHLQHLHAKLGAHNAVELAREALRRGLI